MSWLLFQISTEQTPQSLWANYVSKPNIGNQKNEMKKEKVLATCEFIEISVIKQAGLDTMLELLPLGRLLHRILHVPVPEAVDQWIHE